jgi:hypothetical protein
MITQIIMVSCKKNRNVLKLITRKFNKHKKNLSQLNDLSLFRIADSDSLNVDRKMIAAIDTCTARKLACTLGSAMP